MREQGICMVCMTFLNYLITKTMMKNNISFKSMTRNVTFDGNIDFIFVTFSAFIQIFCKTFGYY